MLKTLNKTLKITSQQNHKQKNNNNRDKNRTYQNKTFSLGRLMP